MSADEETGFDDEEEAEVPSEWLTTLADMSMLLMSFFILLFSMSSLDTQKFSESFSAVQNALGGQGKPGPRLPVTSETMVGPGEGGRFQVFGDGEKHHDHGRLGILAEGNGAGGGDAHQGVDVEVTILERDEALLVNGQAADSHGHRRQGGGQGSRRQARAQGHGLHRLPQGKEAIGPKPVEVSIQ